MAPFFYTLVAFIAGLLLGWLIWGRLRGELDGQRAALDGMRGERDRLKADTSRLTEDLEACRGARVGLERQLAEAKTANEAVVNVAPDAFVSSRVPKAATASIETPAAAAGVRTANAGTVRSRAANSSGKDNLRRLIGIGPVNERRLNEHGVTTFAQIAAWTDSDIRKVEEYLQFDGRIERERWVEQAKLLAAGDERQFARRFPTAGRPGNT